MIGTAADPVVARQPHRPNMPQLRVRQPVDRPVVEKAAGRSQGAASRVRDPEKTATVAGAPAEPPPPTADGQSTLMRALGLKIGRIVIDAGHGGHDSGTLGADGIEEKDVETLRDMLIGSSSSLIHCMYAYKDKATYKPRTSR